MLKHIAPTKINLNTLRKKCAAYAMYIEKQINAYNVIVSLPLIQSIEILN